VIFCVEIVHICNLLFLQITVTEYTQCHHPIAMQTVEPASVFSLIFYNSRPPVAVLARV
jgi:hypothetical protein